LNPVSFWSPGLTSRLVVDWSDGRINGVNLRRVSQAYVIATSTKVDVAGVSIPESVNDSYFVKSKAAKSTKEGEFFGEGKEKKAFPEERKSEQKVCVKPPALTDFRLLTLLFSLLSRRWTTCPST
jgi:large subunit ribosomal protein L6e